MRPCLFVLMAALLCATCCPALAQQPAAPGPAPDGRVEVGRDAPRGAGPGERGPRGRWEEELRRQLEEFRSRGGDPRERDIGELVETVMMVRLSRALDLESEQIVLLVRKMEELREQGHDLAVERHALHQELRDLVTNNAPAEDIESTLTRLLDIEQEMAALKRRKFEESVQEAKLTPEEKGRYFLFLQDFENQLRRMLQWAREGGGSPQGRPNRDDGDPPSWRERGRGPDSPRPDEPGKPPPPETP